MFTDLVVEILVWKGSDDSQNTDNQSYEYAPVGAADVNNSVTRHVS